MISQQEVGCLDPLAGDPFSFFVSESCLLEPDRNRLVGPLRVRFKDLKGPNGGSDVVQAVAVPLCRFDEPIDDRDKEGAGAA